MALDSRLQQISQGKKGQHALTRSQDSGGRRDQGVAALMGAVAHECRGAVGCVRQVIAAGAHSRSSGGFGMCWAVVIECY